MRRVALPVLGVVSALLVLLVLVPRYWSVSVDLPHHYLLTTYIAEHLALPTWTTAGLSSMGAYPPVGHLLAALLSSVLGSAFLAMQVVVVLAALTMWGSIFALLLAIDGRMKVFASIVMLLVVGLASYDGVHALQFHGWEMIANYFYGQFVGQAIFWVVVAAVAWALKKGIDFLRVGTLLAITAPLLAWVHLLPAVELLAFLGFSCLCELALGGRSQLLRGRTLVVLALPVLSAAALVSSSTFRASRLISANDGSLTITYVPTAGRVTLLAAGVCLLSLAWIALWGRKSGRRGPVCTVGLVGLSISAACLAQAASLALGDGSPYAVKKYGFGLWTILAMMVSVAIAWSLDRWLPIRESAAASGSIGAGRVVGAALILGSLAVLGVFWWRPPSPSSEVLRLERDISALERTRVLDVPESLNVASSLPHSTSILDYMFSIATLGAGIDPEAWPTVSAILTGQGVPQGAPVGSLVTAVGSGSDSIACRLAGPVNGLVVINYSCLVKDPTLCAAVNDLRTGGTVRSLQLEGFSEAYPAGRWTIARKAIFRCRIPAGWRGAAAVLRIPNNGAYGLPRSGDQQVDVVAGGVRRSFQVPVGSPGEVEVPIPSLKSKDLEVQILIPGAKAPAELGMSTDSRLLGLWAISIEIVRAQG